MMYFNMGQSGVQRQMLILIINSVQDEQNQPLQALSLAARCAWRENNRSSESIRYNLRNLADPQTGKDGIMARNYIWSRARNGWAACLLSL